MEAAVALFSSPIFQIASTAFQVIGAISDANSKSDAYESQAAWNQYNATIDRQNADTARQQSASEQARQNRRARQVMGEQRAATAQSGTGFGGSNADLLDQSATLAELDMLNIAYEGQMRARGQEIQAQGEDYSAGVNKGNAKRAKRAGIFNAGRSLLTGASRGYGGSSSVSSSLNHYDDWNYGGTF
jgi:hypothetical protein